MEKSHILAEIRRTAAQNRGVPLGVQRFFNETGIKETDWRGKYWVRWGDAIEEAGLARNRLRSAYEESFLLSSLALLVRELGHFPVVAEIKMKVRQDPGFPNPKTFARFGPKTSWPAKVAAFCQKQGGFQDVIDLCAGLADENSLEASQDEPGEIAEFGFVYLLRSGRHYKIGRSNAVGRRERELAIQLPERAKIVHTIKTDDPPGIERYWHGRFEDRRGNGEWFELTAADVAAFKRRKFM